MRYLCIDLGDARTGLAVGDDRSKLASPLRVLEIPAKQRDRLRDAIAAAAREQEAGALVLGLPLNMDGSEGPRAKLSREWGGELAEATGLEVHLHDERLTSVAADAKLGGSGLTRKQKKKRQDAVAAAELLRSFLDPAVPTSFDPRLHPIDPTDE